MHKYWNDKFYALEGGTITGAIEDRSIGKEDIIELMAEDDDKVNDKEPEIKDEKEIKEPEKEFEEEVKLEDIDDVKIEDIPRRQEILKQYPELFKKFPAIEKAIYREQQYAEIFPSISEAREAVDSVKQYKQLESSLLSGDLATVLKAVKNADNDAFKNIGDNILQILNKTDPTIYQNVISDVLETAIYGMASEGHQRQNQALWDAAQILNQFVFQRSDFKKPQVRGNFQQQPNEQEQRLSARELQFHTQQLEVAVNDVTEKATNTIKSTIEKNIDTKNSMSPYVKSRAINDTVSRVQEIMASDTRFSRMLDNLWSSAAAKGFDQASKTAIKNAIYSKAKTVLPDVIRSVRNEALKGSSTTKSATIERDEPETKVTKSSNNEQRTSSPKEDKAKPGKYEKTLDFLMRD